MASKGKELEKMVDRLEESTVAYLKELAESTDPFDMIPTAKKDQLFDWQTRMMNPGYWPKIVSSAISQSQTSGGTLGDAMIAVFEHDAKMAELDAKGVET